MLRGLVKFSGINSALITRIRIVVELWLFRTSNCAKMPILDLFLKSLGAPMKKLLVVICSAVLAFGLAGCIGKAPVGKGKAPVVQTRG